MAGETLTLLGIDEPVWRLGAFAAVFSMLALLELAHPRLERPEMLKRLKARRWFTNLSILVLSSLCLRVVFPAAATGVALYAQMQGFGLLPALGLTGPVGAVAAFLVLDLAVWLEHLASHRIPLLWRLHRVHHADEGFDVTTALRFHPLEILLSMLWKSLVILAVGAPAVTVVIFEIVLNASAMFSHANLRLPAGLDRRLRLLIVTPDMHRVHHSTEARETDSNFGFNLSVWDRLAGLYRAQPERGHAGMEIGLSEHRGGAPSRLLWSLLLPFRRR